MTQHTPGPWDTGLTGNGHPDYVYCNDALGSAVAYVNLSTITRDKAERDANATLIAAAPELLEAARLCMVHFKENGLAPFVTGVDELEAAIAKATSHG